MQTSADFGLQRLIAGGPSGFGPRNLGRLGPPYRPTQSVVRSMPGQTESPYLSNPLPVTSQPSFAATTAATTYNPALQPPPSPVGAVHWQPEPNSSVYGSESSPAVSAAGAFGYAAQQDTPNPFLVEYVSPTALQNGPQPGFDVYSWPGAGDRNMSIESPSPGPRTSSTFSDFGMSAGVPDGGFPDSEPSIYGGVESTMGWQQQQPLPNGTEALDDATRPKRAKKSQHSASSSISVPTPTGPTSSGGNPGAGGSSSSGTGTKTKLRSASRASKNIMYRPEETPQERKSRNSHNLVEKQYRNRLNMQFEILMNTLPESMRSSATVTASTAGGATTSGGDSDGTAGGGGGGGAPRASGGGGGGFDVGERRLSKAQVLDMSARYIRSLEKERDELEEQREGLLENMRRLKEAYVKEEGGMGEEDGVGGQGGGGGGGGGFGSGGG